MKNSWIRFGLYTLAGIAFLIGMLLVMGVRIDRASVPLKLGAEASPAHAPALSEADVTALTSTLGELEQALAQTPQLAAQARAASAELSRMEGNPPATTPQAASSAQETATGDVSQQPATPESDVVSLASHLEEVANKALTTAGISHEEQQFLATTSLFARLSARKAHPQITCQHTEGALELSRAFEGKKTTSPELVRDLDAARQWLEVDAANLQGDARKTALARIAAVDRAIEYALAAGAPDARYAFAPLPDGGHYTTAALSLIAQSVTRHWQLGQSNSLAFTCALIANEEITNVELFTAGTAH